ncbi:MAG: glutaredoxin [Deltaproteobacteria bacterium]|nr:MAG: glutaredoxin [Deltaproteobacteria bacterium]
MLRDVTGWAALQDATGGLRGKVLVAFLNDKSSASRRARPELEAFCAAHSDATVYVVDTAVVRDVHGPLGVTAVPTVAVVNDGKVSQRVVGFNTQAAYEAALLGPGLALDGSAAASGDKPAQRVTVYTGPTCVWCQRVKAYLDDKRVRYKEVDVSRDPSAAQALVAKTGQTGVPQLDINGTWIVGFDKARIDKLLGLAA